MSGFDGLLLENFGDAPFFPGAAPPETVAALSVLAREVKARFPVPLGINVLRNDGVAALALAAAAEADFIRVNVYTGALVFADVDVKHSAPLAARPPGEEVRETLERGRADAAIVSERATGAAVALDDLRAAAGRAALLAGSGATARAVAEILEIADGAIVGTALKAGGVTSARVDPRRARAFVRAARG